MDWQFSVPATLAIAAMVLVVGRRLIERIAALRTCSIPEPVVGAFPIDIADAIVIGAFAGFIPASRKTRRHRADD